MFGEYKFNGTHILLMILTLLASICVSTPSKSADTLIPNSSHVVNK